MRPDVIWSAQAKEDLLDIYVMIGLENVAAADRIYNRLETIAKRLQDHPRLGVRRPDIRPSVRILIEAP